MYVNERGDGEMVLLQGVEVPKVKELRYLEAAVQCNGGCGSEVKRRVQAGWNNWGRVLGVICKRRLSACAKGTVYKMVAKPAMLYVLEMQEAKLVVAELKMLRFSLGVTRMDIIKNSRDCSCRKVTGIALYISYMYKTYIYTSTHQKIRIFWKIAITFLTLAQNPFNYSKRF